MYDFDYHYNLVMEEYHRSQVGCAQVDLDNLTVGGPDENEEVDSMDDPNDPIAFSDDYYDNLVGGAKPDASHTAVESDVIDSNIGECISSHSGARFSRQSPFVSLPTTGAYRGSTIHIPGSKFPCPFISSSSNKRNEGMLRTTTTISDFTGPFHSSGFASIAPSRPSPINMESFASQPNNMQANFGRGSAHAGHVNLVATWRVQ